MLWELVHVFFEHRGLLAGPRRARRVHDSGASASSIPFLGRGRSTTSTRCSPTSRASVLAKAAEVGALRAQTLARAREALARGGARRCARASTRGGTLLALGNGGSATDAMDAVADLRRPAAPAGRPRPAIDLTEDAAILTAVANDIGVEAMFARQVIAYGGARRRAAGVLDERRLGERDRGAGRGAPARAA